MVAQPLLNNQEVSWFDGLNFLSNYSVRGTRPTAKVMTKFYFDFNKKIP